MIYRREIGTQDKLRNEQKYRMCPKGCGKAMVLTSSIALACPACLFGCTVDYAVGFWDGRKIKTTMLDKEIESSQEKLRKFAESALYDSGVRMGCTEYYVKGLIRAKRLLRKDDKC